MGIKIEGGERSITFLWLKQESDFIPRPLGWLAWAARMKGFCFYI